MSKSWEGVIFEIITVAGGFPTTINPIIQYGAIPVFVDMTVPQYNIDVQMLEAALSEKTKAAMIAHTLGNPFDLKNVKDSSYLESKPKAIEKLKTIVDESNAYEEPEKEQKKSKILLASVGRIF